MRNPSTFKPKCCSPAAYLPSSPFRTSEPSSANRSKVGLKASESVAVMPSSVKTRTMVSSSSSKSFPSKVHAAISGVEGGAFLMKGFSKPSSTNRCMSVPKTVAGGYIDAVDSGKGRFKKKFNGSGFQPFTSESQWRRGQAKLVSSPWAVIRIISLTRGMAV